MENHPARRPLPGRIVTLLVGLSLYRMDHSSDLVKASSMQMLTEAAQSRIESQGEVQALNIRRQFMDAYQYGAGFARQVLFLREQAKSAFSMPSTCART
jgi:methyl-accepting chemotaxis protein